jgi:hypothetical protein
MNFKDVASFRFSTIVFEVKHFNRFFRDSPLISAYSITVSKIDDATWIELIVYVFSLCW